MKGVVSYISNGCRYQYCTEANGLFINGKKNHRCFIYLRIATTDFVAILKQFETYAATSRWLSDYHKETALSDSRLFVEVLVHRLEYFLNGDLKTK